MRPIGRLLPIGTCVLALVLSGCGGSGKKTPASPVTTTSSSGPQAAETPLESEPMEHSDGPAHVQWEPDGKLPVITGIRPNIKSVIPDINDFRFDINSVHRDSSGLVTLVWTATNVGTKELGIGAGLGKSGSLEYSSPAASGARLLDATAKVRYWPSRDSQDSCLCSQLVWRNKGTIKPQDSVIFDEIFQVPTGVSTIDVELPWFTQAITLKGIPIR